MKILCFKELLNHISYSWEFPNYDFILDKDGDLHLNKLSITKRKAYYKTEVWDLAPGVYEKAIFFYKFLEKIEPSKNK